MQELVFSEAGRYMWRQAADPQISDGGQAIVRPIAVACCDLDVGVARGVLPMPPGTPSAMRASPRSSPSAMRSPLWLWATASSCRFRSTVDGAAPAGAASRVRARRFR